MPILVAIVVALAVPVAQLRTVAVTHHCCCPDQDDCHCPKDKPDHSSSPTMKPCHSTTQIAVSPQGPSFREPFAVDVAAPVVVAARSVFTLPSPHEPPPPPRPAAPS